MRAPRPVLKPFAKPFTKQFVAIVVTTVATLCAGTSTAQTYPNRPITIIVPFPPGGVTDPVARSVAAKMTESMGQTVLVDNKPGAASIIAAELVKRAPPDGYTVFFGHFASQAVNQFIYAKLPYDPIKDFAPITPLISTQSLLVVPPSSPAKTIAELVALAKTKTGGVTYASQGIAAGGHLLGEMLRAQAGGTYTHVPYKGSAPAIQDILAGRVDMFFDALITAGVHVKDGKLRALGIASPQRSPLFPDVPTMQEAGFPNVELIAWFGMFAPAGTPPAIVNRLNAEFIKGIRQPDIVKRLGDVGLDILTSTPEAFAKLIDEDAVRYAKIVKDANIKAD